jgi:hypothetical protein
MFLQAFTLSWKPLDFSAVCALTAFAAIVLVQWLVRDSSLDALVARAPMPVFAVALATLLVLIVLSPGDTHAFIYFQF